MASPRRSIVDADRSERRRWRSAVGGLATTPTNPTEVLGPTGAKVSAMRPDGQSGYVPIG